ncbi:MAG: hypothetical protein QOI40_1585 [Alphaproteobacteria bacterium]|jgi:hypothetical protein|nr:hypothetical protein [Alphaproteobacteria bacterium]
MRAVPDYHPEFGLLCPSPRRRRGMRLAALCAVTMVAIGATMGLAVARWPASGDGLAAASEPANLSPLAQVSASGGVTPAGHKSCKPEKVDAFKDLLALLLEPDCGPSKHVRHGARTDNRIANVVIGRTDAAPASAPTAETVAAPVEVKPADADKTSNVATAAVEPTKPPKKPRLKARDPARQNAMLNPYTGPRFGHEAYDPYRNPNRPAGVQSGFDPSFGRSW